MMLGAAPILQASASSYTGEYLLLVKISVIYPMMRPLHRPLAMQPKAFQFVTMRGRTVASAPGVTNLNY